MGLNRHTTVQLVKCDTTLADSDEIDFQGASGGLVFFLTSNTATVLTVYALYEGGTEWCPVSDIDGNAVTIPADGGAVTGPEAHPIPADCFGAYKLKFDITTGTDDTTHIYVSLKG